MISPLLAETPCIPVGARRSKIARPFGDGRNSSTGSARVVLLRAYCKIAAHLLHEGGGYGPHL